MQRQNIGSQLSAFLKSGSLLSVLVIVNVAVWVVTLLFPLVDYLYALPRGSARTGWMAWLSLSSQWGQLLRHPWTLLTYMFLHDGLWHLLFNMLMLYWGGVLCLRYLGSRRFGRIYFVSGVAGALLYLLVYNVFPVGRLQVSTLVGASAAVLGVFTAVAAYAPRQEVSFWLVRTFTVQIRYVAMAFVLIDLLSIPASNAGGHIAHLGGIATGWLYVVIMRVLQRRSTAQRKGQRKQRRRKMGAKATAQQRRRPMSDEEFNRRRAEEQKRVDAILDKISKSGYEHLTKEEKEFLFHYK